MFLWILLGVYVFSWISIFCFWVWENKEIKGFFTFLEELKDASTGEDFAICLFFGPLIVVAATILGAVQYMEEKTKKRRENLKEWYKRKLREERDKQ